MVMTSTRKDSRNCKSARLMEQSLRMGPGRCHGEMGSECSPLEGGHCGLLSLGELRLLSQAISWGQLLDSLYI